MLVDMQGGGKHRHHGTGVDKQLQELTDFVCRPLQSLMSERGCCACGSVGSIYVRVECLCAPDV
jgi:hypothetical protein